MMKEWFGLLFSPTTKKGRQVRLWAASIVAGFLLLTLVFTSGLLAAPLVNPTVIYACVTNQANVPHVITTNANVQCSPNETKLNWNQEGPQGPAGPAGQNGRDGQNGLSNGFFAVGPNALHISDDIHHPTGVVSLPDMQAGKYMVTFTLVAVVPEDRTVLCNLDSQNVNSSPWAQVVNVPNSGGQLTQSTALTTVATLTTPGTIEVFCAQNRPDFGEFGFSEIFQPAITAIQVNTINGA